MSVGVGRGERPHRGLPASLAAIGPTAPTARHRPPAVRVGARVGVAALSGVVDPLRLDAGLTALRQLGYEPVVAGNVLQRHGLFAGSDEQRLAGFHQLAADPTIRAIVFARGGHGLLRVLSRIDWRVLRRWPRAYVGYSDLTPFLLEVVRRLGLVAFHGPMVAAELAAGLDSAETSRLLAALGGAPFESLALPGVLTPGRAEGPLLGGCLSMLAATLGTRYRPRLGGAITFLEEVNEPLYRFDRLLTHLDLSGTLTGVAGLVMGHMVGVGIDDGAAAEENRQLGPPPWLGAVADRLAGHHVPAAFGLPAGHGRPHYTLPLGAPAVLDVGQETAWLHFAEVPERVEQ